MVNNLFCINTYDIEFLLDVYTFIIINILFRTTVLELPLILMAIII
jgi:hypothetical protein